MGSKVQGLELGDYLERQAGLRSRLIVGIARSILWLERVISILTK